MALRHDLQQLADAGVLHAPTMSWPLPWSDIKQDVGAADASKLSPRLQSALDRVRKRAALETVTGDIDLQVEVAGTTDPWALRSFEDSPREEGELTVAADWTGERFAWKLSAGAGCQSRRRPGVPSGRFLCRDEPRQLEPQRRLPRPVVGAWLGGQPHPVRQCAPGAFIRHRSHRGKAVRTAGVAVARALALQYLHGAARRGS